MTRLAESHEHARFFALSSDLLCVAGRDGRLKDLNAAWPAALGWTPAELKGRPWLEFVHPDDRDRTREAFAALEAGGPSLRLENRWRRKDGSTLWLSWSASGDPETGLIHAAARDVSEDKRREGLLKEELAQSEKMASVGLLLGGIAHELSNPLTTILGHVQLLLLEDAVPARFQQDLSLILRETGRCTRLLRSLLSFARKDDRGRLPSDLNSLVGEMLELKGYDLRRNGITLSKRLAADLPRVLVDPHQFQQVLLNLLNNAEHAMEGLRGSLRVETRLEAGRVVLTVEDTGPGIPPQALPRLFEPFFTTKPAGQGTGLGLSICARIIKEHGGTIAAEPGPASGARFVVRLPAASRPAPRPARRDGSRLLVLDDDADVLKFLCRAMRQSGREVDGFSAAPDALEALAAASYGAVISDFHMPGMDGETFYRRALALRPELAGRFILLTGERNLAAARSFCEEERISVLVKPFELEEFERVLQATAARAQAP